MAGHYITNEVGKLIENKGIEIVPHYKFNKNKDDDNFVTEYKTNVKDDISYENYWNYEIVRDMKENLLTVGEEALKELN